MAVPLLPAAPSGRRTPILRALGLTVVLTLGTPAAADEPKPESPPSQGAVAAVGAEICRWGSDSLALVTAPVSWDGTDWARFGALSAGVGGLMLADESIYDTVEKHTSQASQDASELVSKFGAEYALGLSVGLLAGGLVFHAQGTRDTGRDAVEASVISGALVTFVLKPAFGRERPSESLGETVFRPFSGNTSFPSGHTTEAFTVASVVAMHSDGWVVPTIAYTMASLVGVARVVHRSHYASDVLAGAVFGTAVGRFVVKRHQPAPGEPPEALCVSLVAIPHGIAVHGSW